MAEEEEAVGGGGGTAGVGEVEGQEATNVDSGRERVEAGPPPSPHGRLHLAFEVAS